MDAVETIYEDALKTAGIPLPTDPNDPSIGLTAAQLRSCLTAAYERGLRDGKRSLMHDEESDLYSQLFQQLMTSLPDHVYFKDLQSRFICVNRSMAAAFGASAPVEMIGKSDFDYFDDAAATVKFKAEQEIIRTGRGWSFREEKDIKLGRMTYVITSKLPLYDTNGKIQGTFGLSRDITKQKFAENEVKRQRRLLETIIQILPCRLFLRDRQGKFLLVNEEYRRCLSLTKGADIIGKTLSEVIDHPKTLEIMEEDAHVIKTGIPVTNKLEFDQSLLTGNRWVLTSKVPLKAESGKIEGIVGITLDITEQKRAENMARRAKEALQIKNRQFEEELLVARQLQVQLMAMGFDEHRMYSKTCEHWNFQASYLYRPSHHLAGDFFYLLPISPAKVGLLVCDVMGHGVKAALVTMLIRGLMNEIPELLDKPGRVLQHLNETILALAIDDEFPRFVTAAYMTIDLERGQAALANAGHPKPILRRHTGQGETYEYLDYPCDNPGPALGIIAHEDFKEFGYTFGETTEAYFFTDGIIEQTTGSGEDFGRDGLVSAIDKSLDTNLSSKLDLIKQTLTESLEHQATTDDICVIALRLEPKK